MLDLAAAFIALTTLLTYVNYRFIRLPPTIGVKATALVFSLIAQGLSLLGYPVLEVEMQEIIRRIDFSAVLMTWFLPALLFAGALHVNLADLRNYKWPIGLLATLGVLIATTVIGVLAYYTFALFGWHVDPGSFILGLRQQRRDSNSSDQLFILQIVSEQQQLEVLAIVAHAEERRPREKQSASPR